MIYAIGDVHGESDALASILARLPVEQTDIVVFLGDLINRGGADPFGCVSQVIAFDRCRKFCIGGNHEESFREYLEFGDFSVLNGMDVQSTLDSYERAGYPVVPGDPSSIPEDHARFYFQSEAWTLPFYITDDYIFTHAGWNLQRSLEQQSSHDLAWGNVKGYESPVWTQTVVRGHTPMPKVTFSRAKHTIGVDTGCGMGGRLSAVALPSEKTFAAVPTSFHPRWYFK